MGSLIELEIPTGYTAAFLCDRLKRAGLPTTLVNLKSFRAINNSSDPLAYLYNIFLKHLKSIKDSKSSFLILDKFDVWASSTSDKQESESKRFKSVESIRNLYLKSVKLAEGVEDKVNKCNVNWTYKFLYWIRNSVIYLLEEEFKHNLTCVCVYADPFNLRVFYDDLVDGKYSLEDFVKTDIVKNLDLKETKQTGFDVLQLKKLSKALNFYTSAGDSDYLDSVYDNLSRKARILNLNVPFEVDCESIDLAPITLIVGAEGSGKSTLLKSISKYWHNQRYSKSGSDIGQVKKGNNVSPFYVFNLEYYELSSQYVGCAESYVKNIFTKAKYNKPSLVVFDGIELLFERVPIEEERAIPVTYFANTQESRVKISRVEIRNLSDSIRKVEDCRTTKTDLKLKMQVIKPIGAILIHSAYINSEGSGYHRCRNISNNHRNNGNFKGFASTNSFTHVTGVIESDLPSIIAAKFETPLLSREDKLKHLLSNQAKEQYTDSLALETSTTNGTSTSVKPNLDYIDEFNGRLLLKKGVIPDMGNDIYDGNEFRGRNYLEMEKFKDLELGKIRRHEMRNMRIYKSKNLKFEEKYGMESEDGSSSAYNRDHWASQGHDPRASSKLSYRKRKRRLYDPIEVRLSLRIQEADLLNKCKFFKKKALKGYPLNFIIRVDGNPDEFMLAAEGILNKARMFLSDACTASGNLSKSKTTISLHFKPLNIPEEDDLEEYPSSPVRRKSSSYLSHLDTEELSESYNMGDYNDESPVAASMGDIRVVPPEVAKTDMDVTSTLGNTVESVDPGSGSALDEPLVAAKSGRKTEVLGNTSQDSQEKPSRFMTLNKKKVSRWIYFGN
ncbi:hypothetical protein MACJ_002865 [Theileria orientalis]|uniref:AAA+ ATPase domain-containing protein n=1 Tax=Theileria orientalis TaxID=68886 RepID=A0A976M6U6_THEOR|nr:hypothetical protein MACJ_002865 [Theileria orientalis]